MSDIAALVADNLDIWSSAIERKSSSGRGSSKKSSLYGIERLRALVLDLAVRGKLVQQGAVDEPASKLLLQFDAQRDHWIAEKRIRRRKPLPTVGEDEYRFDPPEGWSWTRFGNLGDWGAGATPNRKTSSYYGGETPWFKSGELVGDYISQSEETVTELALQDCSLRLNAPGDVLIAMYGATIGKASILEIAATTNQAVCACSPFDGVDNRFLLILLRAMRPIFVGQGAGGAQPNISREKVVATPLCLPPTAEQKRIVAKVDELMALCDALEQESEDALAAHQTLVETLLATLVNSTDAADLAKNWARLAKHFDTLFTTEASIDALKQTILDLAVRGMLVEQNPNEEPAQDYLARILKDKSARPLGSRQRKEKFARPPAPPFPQEQVPEGWLWTRFGDIMISRDAERMPISSADRAKRKGDFDYYGASGVIDQIDDYLFDQPLLLIGEDGANLINRSTPIAFIATGKYWVNNHAHVLDGISLELLRYVEMFINAIDLKPYVTGTAQPKMNQAKMNSIAITLPPEGEQRRILAKVGELMNLCETIKDHVRDAAETQRRLADTIVERAVG